MKNTTFLTADEIGLTYPIEDPCPVVDYANGGVAGNCTMGQYPVYTINATTVDHVKTAVDFARQRGIRLVIRNTGHDMIGRSTGAGSLQVWIHNLRQGIEYTTTSPKCKKQTYTGPVFNIKGGYQWRDAYEAAFSRDLIIVGGGDPSVGVIGGWLQGGGHSPANHDYGMGSDQAVSFKVVTSGGGLVTASACENSDLYWALRGGAGGTYGIVVEAQVKVYPTTPYTAQVLALAPLSAADNDAFLEAISVIYESFPEINDGGLHGYGSWYLNSYQPIVGPYYSGYNHALAAANKTVDELKALWAPVAERLSELKDKLYISVEYPTFKTYEAYYNALCGAQQQGGSSAAIGSRMLGKEALSNATGVRNMIKVLGGNQYEFTVNNFALVGGGKVFADAADPYSGLHPGWRKTYALHIVARGALSNTPEAVQAVHDDITYNKVGAMREISPAPMGGYLNEGDRLSPTVYEDWFGSNLNKLKLVKLKWDPLGVFYCPTCVGSQNWYVDSDRRLCYDFGIYDY
jgi:hypothetical protein